MTTESVPGREKGDPRRPEVDWIKAVAITTVVLIHCLPPFFAERVTSTELWLSAITRFAVPSFLFASGFLYASSGSQDWLLTMGRRLKRLLIPYLLFSGLAYLIPPVSHQYLVHSDSSFVAQLLSGSALGEYYYIFVIFWMILGVPLFARIPRSVFPGAILFSLFLQWGFETGFFLSISPFWAIRNPVRWIATFLIGWWVFENRISIQRAIEAHRLAWLGSLAAVWVGLAIGLGAVSTAGLARSTLVWAEIYASIGVLFAASVGTRSAPRAVRWLSDVSYSIYLSHLFFLDSVLRAIPRTPGVFAPLRLGTAWVVGLGGGAAVAAAARLVLGERRARAWFG